MKRNLFVIFTAIALLFSFSSATPACWDCNDADTGGELWVDEGQNQSVTPSTYDPNGATTFYDANQWISGGGWSVGDFIGTVEAFKVQSLAWDYQFNYAEHFGQSFMEAYGLFGVNPDCPEAQFDLSTYAFGTSDTNLEAINGALSMYSGLNAGAGGNYWGFGDPLAGGFNILLEMGNIQEFGNPDNLLEGPYGFQYDKILIDIKAGTVPQ